MTNNTTVPALTDEQILDFFSAAGVELNATPNMLYTVRGQHAQLVKAARALLTSPRAAVPAPDLYWFGDHEHGFECPDDAAIVHGRKLGDRFTLKASWYADMLFEVTKVPNDNDDDYEVREVDAAPAAPVADKADEQQAYEQGYQHGLAESAIVYTAAMGDAAEKYFDSFKHAHPLPAQFRWNELYEAMVSAVANSDSQRTHTSIAEIVCSTCNGQGMIGGPSFYAPDEGGVLCPDCAQAVAADGEAQDDIEGIARAAGCTNIDLIGDRAKAIERLTAFAVRVRAAVSPAAADTTWKTPKQHCQNGGDVCLAGNRDGVCCPEDSCDIDDGTRNNPATADERSTFEHLDVQNHRYRCALRKIMARLADLLDEDQFGNIESIVREVGVSPIERASQAAAPQANAAEESEDAYVIRRLSETLADVAVTLRGDDPVHPDDPLNKIELVKRLAEVLRMEVELYRAQAAAPAEAREPGRVGRVDIVDGKVQSFAFEQTDITTGSYSLYTAPVSAPADAGEAVAPVVAALRKLVHLKSLKDGADRCVPGYIEDRIEYQRDKPKAWDDARAALASFDAAQGAQGGKGGEA